MADMRLSDLEVQGRKAHVSKGYSRFIKAMRYILPLMAAALMVIVITWTEMDDKIIAIPKSDILPSSDMTIGQTELTNPRFESVDELNQPVTVIADRALQNQNNPDIVNLENPVADFKTEKGDSMHVEAIAGTLEQKEEKLFLQNNVKITHQDGYLLEAEELRVNMKTKETFSDKDVIITSDKAVINAEGLDGNMEKGILIFKGPATLILHNIPEDSL